MSAKKATGKHGNVRQEFGTGHKVPDAIKKLRGTYHKRNADLAARKVGASDASQLMLPVDVPEELTEPPATLISPAAVQEWNLFIKPLITADVIKLSDLRIAEMYCDMWAVYLSAKDLIRVESAQNAQAILAYPTDLAGKLSRLMAQMGLTPVSRHRVVRLMADKGRVTNDDWKKILDHDP